MRSYCTLFDRNYLSRGLALHASLMRHGGSFRLHVLCLDVPTFNALSALALPNVELIADTELEAWDRELQAARSNRSPVEFYFTCKSVLMRHVLASNRDVDRITYLDSDLYFFSDPGAVEREFAHSSVALTPHRFPDQLAFMKRSGVYNAGWISVAASAEGHRFLEWWRARCIEWCRVVFEETRFGDQKYLDQVPLLFRDVVSVTHPGLNAAPWNIGALHVEARGAAVDVEGQPLVAFHFHGIHRLLLRLYDSGLSTYRASLSRVVRDHVFRPYLEELARCEAGLSALPPALRSSIASATTVAKQGNRLDRLKLVARVLASRTALIGP